MPNCLEKTQASIFADDTNIVMGIRQQKCGGGGSIQSINNIQDWLTDNKLMLNKDKTEYMVVGSRQRQYRTDNRRLSGAGGKDSRSSY